MSVSFSNVLGVFYKVAAGRVDNMSLKDGGTITFRPKHDNSDWTTDDNIYRFPPFERGGIGVQATKMADCTLAVKVTGPLGGVFLFKVDMPGANHLQVTVTWKLPDVKLYLNGLLAASQSVED